MSNRIPSSPMLKWTYSGSCWQTVLQGRVLTLLRSGDKWQVKVDGQVRIHCDTFCDGAQIASLMPQFQWNAALAQTADIAARIRRDNRR